MGISMLLCTESMVYIEMQMVLPVYLCSGLLIWCREASTTAQINASCTSYFSASLWFVSVPFDALLCFTAYMALHPS